MTMRIAYDDCPLCGCEDAEVRCEASCARHALYQPELPATMRWLICERCRHVFVDGYFTDEALAILFRETNVAQTPGDDPGVARALSARMVDRVVHESGRSAGELEEARWLDVGFGNGGLLTTAAEYGYRVVGLDLRAKSVARMRAFGFEAHCVDLTKFETEGRFDVLSMADVLEHVPFPKPVLARARELLEDDGVLLVSMPNLDSFVWNDMDQKLANPYWGEIEHLHNFGRRRLYSLLVEMGFRPASYGVSERYIACMEILARKG